MGQPPGAGPERGPALSFVLRRPGRGSRLQFHRDAIAPNPRDEGAAVFEFRFVEETLGVGLYGLEPDAEDARDLSIGLALGHPAADLLLARGKVRRGMGLFRDGGGEPRRIRNGGYPTPGSRRVYRCAGGLVVPCGPLHHLQLEARRRAAVSLERGRSGALVLLTPRPLLL